MSVLIPGMEMPTSCFQCKLLDYTDTFKCRYRFESLAKEHGINIKRPDWCPLIPVPPHGRLIDADEAEERGFTLCRLDDMNFYPIYRLYEWDEFPTIIPAEEGEG